MKATRCAESVKKDTARRSFVSSPSRLAARLLVKGSTGAHERMLHRAETHLAYLLQAAAFTSHKQRRHPRRARLSLRSPSMDAARARGFHDSAVSSTRTVVNDLPSRAAPMRADRVSSHGLNLISFIQPTNDAPINYAWNKFALLAAAICLTTSNGLLAQIAATPATGSDKLEEIVVKGANLEDQVSPLQRKVTSVFALELSVLYTPPAVPQITAAPLPDH